MSLDVNLIGESHVDTFLFYAIIDSFSIKLLNDKIILKEYVSKVKNVFDYINSFFNENINDKLKDYDYKILIMEGFFDEGKLNNCLKNRSLKISDFNQLILLDTEGYDKIEDPSELECEIRETDWLTKLRNINMPSSRNTGVFIICGDYHLRDNSKLNYNNIRNYLNFGADFRINYNKMSDSFFNDYFNFINNKINNKKDSI